MKTCLLVLAFLIGASCLSSHGQVIPSQPTNFNNRNLGTGVNPGTVGVAPVHPGRGKKSVTIQYIGVAPERAWTNAKGKVIRAMLLAFENGPAENAVKPLTIIRGEKIRLLRQGSQKPGVVALATLSDADREFVRKLDAASRKDSKAASIAAPDR
jgi:hypothetical protein